MKGFRTFAANVVLALPLILDVSVQLLGAPEVVRFIPHEYMPYYGLVMVVLNIFLRTITTTPIFRAQ